MAVLTVTELNRMVRLLLEGDDRLQEVVVLGEISNFKAHTSGHLYFSLRDEAASVRAVMFRSRAERLGWVPENGQSVLAFGRVSLYERDGAYQLYVDSLEPVGVGSRYLALQELRARLEAEGLFRADRKRPLPSLPRLVGVVTARSGAALRDILTVARRRNPRQSLVVAPTLVQGPFAPPAIVAALEALYALPEVDVIILGRGGGAKEDLSAFDTEEVVRAVARSPVPIVSAVGHEVDVTLTDFAADARAPTPSAAAELVVPERRELLALLDDRRVRLRQAMSARLALARRHLASLTERRLFRRPEELLARPRERLDRGRMHLAMAMARRLEARRRRFAEEVAKLEALSPLAVLARGYAVLSAEGKTVRSVHGLKVGGEVAGRLVDGAFTGRVLDIEAVPWEEGDRR
jgi:exodeoxyribonuclease VII large subunit